MQSNDFSLVQFIHSYLRYFILILAVVVVVQSLMGMLGKKKFMKGNKMPALFLLICCDLQLVLGLVLYVGKGWAHVLTSGGAMAAKYTRFWSVEHSVGMIAAIVLVHVGYAAIKKNIDDDRKFKRLFWCTFLSLVILLATIPWAGKQEIGRPNIPTMSA